MPFRMLLLLCVALSGCIVPEAGVRPNTYDFGQPAAINPTATQPLAANAPVLAIGDVQAPRYLESNYLYYRLLFSDAQLPKPYADSRWSMPPAQLVSQRLKGRLAQSALVTGLGEARADLVLRVELEQFDQVFDSPEASRGVVRLRASLIRDRRLVAQQSFAAERPAASANAAGGAHALTAAADAALDALAAWVVQAR